MILTPEQRYINNIILSKNKINKNALEFYHEFYEFLQLSAPDPLITTSDRLAQKFNKSTRTIQRYMKQLQEFQLVHVRHIYNNDNPDKPFIEKNHYSSTPYAEELHEKAKYYVKRDVNVYFEHKSL